MCWSRRTAAAAPTKTPQPWSAGMVLGHWRDARFRGFPGISRGLREPRQGSNPSVFADRNPGNSTIPGVFVPALPIPHKDPTTDFAVASSRRAETLSRSSSKRSAYTLVSSSSINDQCVGDKFIKEKQSPNLPSLTVSALSARYHRGHHRACSSCTRRSRKAVVAARAGEIVEDGTQALRGRAEHWRNR